MSSAELAILNLLRQVEINNDLLEEQNKLLEEVKTLNTGFTGLPESKTVDLYGSLQDLFEDKLEGHDPYKLLGDGLVMTEDEVKRKINNDVNSFLKENNYCRYSNFIKDMSNRILNDTFTCLGKVGGVKYYVNMEMIE